MFVGIYAACGFEILLKRKHEPLMYQVGLKDRLLELLQKRCTSILVMMKK